MAKKKPNAKKEPSAFAELVTRLRDDYFDSVPKDAWRQHSRAVQMTLSGAELDKEVAAEEAELAREFQALPLGIVQHYWLFLHPEGRVLIFNLLYDEVTDEPSEPHSLDYGLRVGFHRFPELATLITPRPDGATDCGVCAGKGWSAEPDRTTTCELCWGRGWYPPGLGEMLERTSTALGEAGADYDATVVAIQAFLNDGMVLGFSASLLCAAFDLAVQMAGYDDEQRQLRQQTCGAVAVECFPGWTYWVE